MTELPSLLPCADLIVVAGVADVTATIEAFQMGVTDYLLKPVQPDVIRRSVSRIANRKRIENRFLREQRFANQVLDTSEALIVVLDLEARVVRFNRHFTKVTGWKWDDLAGKDYIDHCIPEAERERLREIFSQAVKKTRINGVRNGVLTTDGRIRQIRWSDSMLTDDTGEINSVLAIGLDVTDAIEAQQAADRGRRLAAIGETVAGLAHESRNALHRINASVEMLRLDIPIESDLREEIDAIARASHELHNTLEEVRQYAAPIALHREEVYLHDVWRRVWNYLARSRADRDAELIEANCGCGCTVDVDVLRAEQMFRNLFENSLAACRDPVRIHVGCKCDGPEMISLDIEDNGPGLSIEQREKLFEPFYTTKPKGTGLGMSIVQRIVESHGGDIKIGDSDGGGARFHIRLGKHESVIGTPCRSDGTEADA